MSSNLESTGYDEPLESTSMDKAKVEMEVSSPSIPVVLETVLNLRSQELAVYDAIDDNPGISTKALAEAVSRDRSNVNRSLCALEDAGFVTRNRRILDEGGFYFAHYTASSCFRSSQ